MSPIRNVPVYKLYGEFEQWQMPEMVHCETIAARSQLHDWQIEPHQHHGLFQILYLKSGTANIRLDDQHQKLRAGEILLVPQMCIHGFKFSRDADGHVITLAYPLLIRITQGIGEWLTKLGSPHIHRLDVDDESACMKTVFSAINNEYKGNGAQRNLLMESLLQALLIWLGRTASRSAREQSKEISRGEEHFGNFCALIELDYASHFSVAHYAQRIGITAAHLNVLCRQAVGQSALALVHERVLLEAKRKLVYTSMTVSIVSDTLGFSDPAYFTRFFKRRTGLSPKDFRNRAKTLY